MADEAMQGGGSGMGRVGRGGGAGGEYKVQRGHDGNNAGVVGEVTGVELEGAFDAFLEEDW